MQKGCFSFLNGYEVKDKAARESARRLAAAVNSLRRKINAHSNTLTDLVVYKRKEIARLEQEQANERCSVNGISTDGTIINVNCSTGNELRKVSISIKEDANKFEITHLSGYKIKSLFTTGTANKTFLGAWVDGKKHDTIDVLMDTALSFKSLVIVYSVACDGYTINVCYTINARGFTVYESVPEALETNPLLIDTLKTNYADTYDYVYSDTPTHSVFAISDDEKKKIYIESVFDMGQCVVKKVDFNGGL